MILREERIGGQRLILGDCRRVDEAARQPDLLIQPPKPQPIQEGFDL